MSDYTTRLGKNVFKCGGHKSSGIHHLQVLCKCRFSFYSVKRRLCKRTVHEGCVSMTQSQWKCWIFCMFY